MRRPLAWAWAWLFTLAVTLPAAAESQVQARSTRDPQRARFVYRDVERFIATLRKLERAPDRLAVLRREYFERGTPGLDIFVEKYELTPEGLAAALAEHPNAFRSLGDKVAALRAREDSFRSSYARLLALIPDAEFPPTYFLVGAYNNIASGSIRGTLITVERRTPQSIASGLETTMVHEMVHMQQLRALGEQYFAIYGSEKSLLALAIREGIAVFFSQRAVGLEPHRLPARDYLLAHEKELWCRFRESMAGAETGDWMWSRPSDPKQPADLGYVLGARIVEAYYERAPVKAEAVRRILSVTDYPAFLRASGYEGGRSERCSPPAHPFMQD